ncbi:MAG TPA: DUF4350 domain-containing protein [Galbitalea sp.]|jgi:hypothetical protein
MTLTDHPRSVASTPERRVDVGEESGANEIVTSRARTVARRLFFWVVVAAILAVFVVAVLSLTGTSTSQGRLSAHNPNSVGAKALVNVLRQDHVNVSVAATLRAAKSAASLDPAGTTLMLYDPSGYLKSDQLASLVGVAGTVVLIEPSFQELSAFAPDIHQAGAVPSRASANCDLPLAERAGKVTGLDHGYRVTNSSGSTTACFGSAGVYSLVNVETDHGPVFVLGGTTVLTNGSILHSGNAALGLGLFGQTSHLVWYLPSFADSNIQQDGAAPLPSWVLPSIILVALVFIAAAIWRGRRFGPLVIERMPVTVRSSETIEGRARLYQRSSARTRVLDSLRIGTLDRLAKALGLPKLASIDDIVGSVESLTGRQQSDIRALLVDELPTNDRALLRLSDDLRDLERDVAKRVSPQ